MRELDQDFERVVEHLKAAGRLLLTTHIYPDGDGVGSELGLARAMRTLGREVHIFNSNSAPRTLSFLDSDGEIVCLDHDGAAGPPDVDLVLVLDTSEPVRLGRLENWFQSTPVVKVCVDHHISTVNAAELFDARWGVVEAAATGCLALEIIDALGVELDAAIAAPLYVAIGTDTGWFRYANTNAWVHRTAARLVEAGARPNELYEAIYCNHSLARMTLLGDVLASLQSCLDGQFVYVVLTREMMERRGVIYEDIDGFVDELKVIHQVEVVALIVELSGENVKVSLRSQGEANVNAIARHFGGGGHEKAAGYRTAGNVEALIDELKAEVVKAVR